MDTPADAKEKPGFVCEFADEFTGPSLDRSRWFPHMLPHWSTLKASAARYRFANNALQLMIEADQGRWRPGMDRASNLSTGHFSGPKGSGTGQFKWDPAFIVSEDIPRFSGYVPRFGFFEIRLKAAAVTGYHTALWMVGYDAPEAGEIRVFELHGGNIHKDRSRVDYGVLRWSDPELVEETYEDWHAFDASQYHIYAIDWTPTHIDFLIDGKLVRRLHQSPQYPMQFLLGLYERPQERSVTISADRRGRLFSRLSAGWRLLTPLSAGTIPDFDRRARTADRPGRIINVAAL